MGRALRDGVAVAPGSRDHCHRALLADRQGPSDRVSDSLVKVCSPAGRYFYLP